MDTFEKIFDKMNVCMCKKDVSQNAQRNFHNAKQTILSQLKKLPCKLQKITTQFNDKCIQYEEFTYKVIVLLNKIKQQLRKIVVTFQHRLFIEDVKKICSLALITLQKHFRKITYEQLLSKEAIQYIWNGCYNSRDKIKLEPVQLILS